MPLASKSHPIHVIHRAGAAALGLGLWVFAALGFAQGLSFFSTRGEPILGLSSNGLLSTISLVAGAVLLAAALLGGPIASTTTTTLGVAFLVSGLAHFAILHTAANILAFGLSNVFFSIIAGMLLLFLGVYGRVTGGLPDENPYRRARRDRSDYGQSRDNAARDAGQKQQLIAAELAVAEGHATVEQEALVAAERRRQRRSEQQRIARNVNTPPSLGVDSTARSESNGNASQRRT